MLELIKFSLFWVIANIAPLICYALIKDNYSILDSSENKIQTITMCLAILFAEGYIISVVYQFFKKFKLASYIFTSALICIHCISWNAFIRYQEFINPILDKNLTGFIFSEASWQLYVQNKDIVKIILFFSFALIISILLLKLIDLKKINLGKFALLKLILPLLTTIALTNLFANKKIALSASNMNSQGSLYLPFFYSNLNKTYESQKLSLIRRNIKEESHNIVDKRNYIIILAEALRHDVVKNHSEFSPYLNSLMNSPDAVSFSRAHSTATDSLSAFISVTFGRYPLLSEKGHWNADKVDMHQSLYSFFQNNDYTTSHYSSFDWFTVTKILEKNPPDYISDPTLDAGALRLVNQLKNKCRVDKINKQKIVSLLDDENIKRFKSWVVEQEKPFFASMLLYGTHFPYTNKPNNCEDLSSNQKEKSYYYPAEDKDYQFKSYLHKIKYMDRQIKDLVSYLKAAKLYDNTTIIIAGDHGEEFYEHGNCLHVGKVHQVTTHVPLIFINPPSQCLNVSNNNLTSLVDVAPTIYEMSTGKSNKSYQGINICSNQNNKERVIFSTSNGFIKEDAAWYKNWLFVRNYKGQTNRLFNLKLDRSEKYNLIRELDSNDQNNNTQASKQISRHREIKALLSKKTSDFRDKQLSYYENGDTSTKLFYPPLH